MAAYNPKSLDAGKIALAAYCRGATTPSLISAKPPPVGANLLTTSYFIPRRRFVRQWHDRRRGINLGPDIFSLLLRSSFAFPQLFTSQVLPGGEKEEVTRLNHHQRRPKKWIIPLFLSLRILLTDQNSFIMSDKNQCYCCPSFSSGKMKSRHLYSYFEKVSKKYYELIGFEAFWRKYMREIHQIMMFLSNQLTKTLSGRVNPRCKNSAQFPQIVTSSCEWTKF